MKRKDIIIRKEMREVLGGISPAQLHKLLKKKGLKPLNNPAYTRKMVYDIIEFEKAFDIKVDRNEIGGGILEGDFKNIKDILSE